VVTCPSCHAKLKAPETLIGKSVKCPGCSKPVLVRETASAPAPKPAAARSQAVAPTRKKVREPIDDLDELDEDAPPPRKGAITKKPARRDDAYDAEDEPRPKKRKVVEDDYDDEDAPRPKKGKARDDDYDDEDEDAPRAKKKAKKVGAGAGGPTSADDRQNAFLMYIILIVGNMIGIGPVGGIIWWFMKRKESRFVDYHGKQYINAQISYFVMVMLVWIVCAPVGIGLYMAADMWIFLVVFLGLAFVLTMAVAIVSLISLIKGILAARAGDWYIPLMTWQLLK